MFFMISGFFRKYKNWFYTLISASFIFFIWYQGILLLASGGMQTTDFKSIGYTTAEQLLKEDKISKVWYGEDNTSIYMEDNDGNFLKFANPKTDKFKKFLLSSTDVPVIEDYKLKFSDITRDENLGVFSFVAMLFYVGFFFSLGIRMYVYWFDKNKVAVSNESKVVIKSDKESKSVVKKYFSDIAGLEEVKEDMRCLVDFIVNKKKYLDAGAKLPKGVILYGPPGTGKTLLAKAVANEADVAFYYMGGSDFIEQYVGVGAKRVRELFDRARKHAPCIIFIDEIDAIGGSRDGDKDASSEDRKTINALLTEMDGFKDSENIIVIGATNRIEDLDSALLRPGRFTNKYCVPLPQTVEERREVINLYVKNKYLSDNLDLNRFAKETIGFSPAKIEALLNEAAIIQVQRGDYYITQDTIDEAMAKLVLNGHIRKDQSNRQEAELRVVAWHEAGHALVGTLLGKDITKVTILSSTSGAGGVTFSIPKDTRLMSAKDLREEVMELYGGRVAELLYFNGDKSRVTTGASNDIERATDIIASCIINYGMSEDYGLLNTNRLKVSGNTVASKCVKLSKEIEAATIKLLEDNKDKLRTLAELLLDKETIYTSDINAVIND